MLSQSFLFFRKQTHLCVCIIFKITCETKSQVSGNFAQTHTPYTPDTHTHSEMGHNFPLVHATHSLTLINDLYPPNSPYSLPGSSHIKFSTRKPETVQAKAAFYVRRRRMREGGRQGGKSGVLRIPDAFMAWKLLLFTKPWTLKPQVKICQRKKIINSKQAWQRQGGRERKGGKEREREGQGEKECLAVQPSFGYSKKKLVLMGS